MRLQGPVLPALREGPHGAFHTKPDAVIRTACGHAGLIVDTKWKRLDRSQRHEGVSQADIYQMMAYVAVHTAPAALLLLPLRDTPRGAGPAADLSWPLSGRLDLDGHAERFQTRALSEASSGT